MPQEKQVSLLRLFFEWFSLSVQSFGGGPATVALIRLNIVERLGWTKMDEFNRDWAVSQMTPGINLLSFTILQGRRIAGPTGGYVALLGLLLPSVTLTLIITSAFATLRSIPAATKAIDGVVPASVGIGLYTAIGMGRAAFVTNGQQKIVPTGLAVLILLGAFVALFCAVPVLAILFVSAGIAAVAALVRRVEREAKA